MMFFLRVAHLAASLGARAGARYRGSWSGTKIGFVLVLVFSRGAWRCVHIAQLH